jgi:hypothetical protein
VLCSLMISGCCARAHTQYGLFFYKLMPFTGVETL